MRDCADIKNLLLAASAMSLLPDELLFFFSVDGRSFHGVVLFIYSILCCDAVMLASYRQIDRQVL